MLTGVFLGLLSCTTWSPEPAPRDSATARSASEPAAVLQHRPLDPTSVTVEAEAITIESSWLLDVYTAFHSRAYTARRISFSSAARRSDATQDRVVAHWLVPSGGGPRSRTTVLVFPILAGSHVVSEALAKALVNRGFSVVRLERKPLQFETAESPTVLADAFAESIRDARQLLDWLVVQPEVDASRIGVAGISLGGILASLLHAVDPRVRAGFFVMAGGGLAEIIHDSAERPIRVFRDQMRGRLDDPSRDDFLAWIRPYTEPVDPLRYAGRIRPESVLLTTARFDRVIPAERSEALWEALGRPRWTRVPVGHYQGIAFLWWVVSRGADHFDATMGDRNHGLDAAKTRFSP